jgi:hypothetical protein
MNKIVSYYVVIPHLKYKEGNIYYVPPNAIKITVKKDIKYINELKLSDILFSGRINITEFQINYELVKQELTNGLKVIVNIHSNESINKKNIEIFAKYITANILGIELDDINNEIKYDYDTNNEIKSKYDCELQIVTRKKNKVKNFDNDSDNDFDNDFDNNYINNYDNNYELYDNRNRDDFY